jgi:hypothetical protein
MNYNSQLKAWAIDRAIETLKVAAGGALTAAAVIEVANQYCAFTDTPEPEAASEAIQ